MMHYIAKGDLFYASPTKRASEKERKKERQLHRSKPASKLAR